MGLFGGRKADEPEEKPQQCRVKVLNSEGKVLFEKVVLKDDLDYNGSEDSIDVTMEALDGKETIVLAGHKLVVIEDL